LNRTAWNGLYRVNRWGEFNVPWGAREFSPPTLENLRLVSSALAGVSIEIADFRDSLRRAKGGDFVYLDPPYLKVSDTSKFNGYTRRRFRAGDLAELAGVLTSLTSRGVRWLLSNRDSSDIRELFAGHEIVRLKVRRSVAAQNRRDVEPSDSPEIIVSNRPLLS
jgi:DNA adenine methylase